MDKTYKISQVTEAKGGDIVIDNSLSTTSTNPVQNKVITNKLITKQDKLIAGDNITIEGNVISSVGSSSGGVSKDYVDRQDALKQDKLTAGDNITIIDNVISATGGGGTIPPEQLEQIETNKNDIIKLKEDYDLGTKFDVDNFNTSYIYPRKYAVGKVEEPINAPTDAVMKHGIIEIFAFNEINFKQVWHPMGNTYFTSSSDKTYQRYKTSFGFTQWELINENDIITNTIQEGTDILTFDFKPFTNGTLFKGTNLVGLPQDVDQNKDVVIQLVKFNDTQYKLILTHIGSDIISNGTYENYHYTDKYRGWQISDGSNKQNKLTSLQMNYIDSVGLLKEKVKQNTNDINTLKNKKITAGNGIKISSDGEISSKVKFYNTLPSTNNLEIGDIVLVPIE